MIKKIKQFLFINTTFILTAFLPFLFLSIITSILVYPLWETTVCGSYECTSHEHHIVYSRKEFNGLFVKEYDKLEVIPIKDNVIKQTVYFIGTKNSVKNREDNRYIFSTGYYSKNNAQRDLELIKNNNYEQNPLVKITKKNTGYISALLIGIYLFLLIFGIIIGNMIKLSEYSQKQNYKK